jgi:putative drug exporter of the RND superfamily
MNALLEGLGGFAARRWWVFIVAWLIILAGLLGARKAFGGEFVNNYTVPGSDSSIGSNLLSSQYPQQSGYGGQIVFATNHGTVTQNQNSVNEATQNIAKLPNVVKAVSPFATPNSPQLSKNGQIAYSSVSWSVNPAGLTTSYRHQLDQAVSPAQKAGLEVQYGGGAGEIGQKTDDLRSEALGLICALVLLLFMFGSVITALMPLVSAIFSVGSGLALVGLLAAATTFPTTAPTVATLLGLGVAVDYGLFLVARHREQLDDGEKVVPSAAKAEGTSGAAIVIAGSTVIVSILALYISQVPFIGALGLASAITVAVTMLAALTLVPSFMGVTKENVRSLAARVRAHRQGLTAREEAQLTAAATEKQHENSGFARWGRRVSNHPLPYGLAALAVLVVLAIPLFSMNLGQIDNGANPPQDSSRQAYDLIEQGFGPGVNGPLTVVVQLPKQSSSANSQLLSSLGSSISKTNGVASVSPPSVNSSDTVAVINVIPTTAPQNQATTTLVNNLRDNVLPSAHTPTYITGTVAGNVDFTERAAGRMIWLILAVVAIAFILLTCAFRSVVIATKAAVLNLLSVGASFGVIVAVFQWGWGSNHLGMVEKVPIAAFVPMMVFVIVFGLSMDYEVFLLSRVHEAWIRTGDEKRAVAIGIGSTARVITTAAAIMVTVFASFLLDSDPTVKMLALGMAVAVLIDASIVRMVLVPSIMTLLGKWAWWMPHWMEPVVPHLQLEGSDAAEAGKVLVGAGAVAGPDGAASGDGAVPPQRTAPTDRGAGSRPGD